MADTNTPVYGFVKPENGASDDSWGTKLNANWTKTDNILGGTTPVTGIDINGGTIDGTQLGASVASTVVGTTVTATNFVGPIAGAVTGNVTGNTAGVHTGAVTGNVTGNVTANTGTSAFNHVTIAGSLDMDAGTSATITGLSNPVQNSDAATKAYVDTSIANVIDNAPAALDTLNELAAAMGDDASFSTTVTNSIATKLPKSGGTMTGILAMGTNKITGLGTPSAGTDAVNKAYVDAGGSGGNKLNLSGGTMSGVIAMGANKITGVSNPTQAQDASTKGYTDTLFGSTAAAATSAAAANTSAGNAATSATNSGSSATASANSATAAAASFDSFDDRYLGAKSSNPSVDNDGNSLITGALYFNSSANSMRVYNGSSWADAGSAVNGTSQRVVYTATASQTSFSVVYDAGFVDVYLNGIKLQISVDYAATSGTAIVLATGATVGDIVDIVSYGAFNLANTYTQAQTNTLISASLAKSGGTMTGALNMGSNNVTTTGKVLFANMYSQVGDLPSASTYHGMFAHVHATGKGYYAHAGAWVELANQTDLASTTTTAGAALAKAGGAMTGAITTNSTFDGRDVAADGVTADAALPKAGGTLSGAVNFADQIAQRPVLKDYAETKVAMAAHDVNLTLGNVQTYTLSGGQTVTFSNPPASGTAGSFTMIVTNGGSATLTWPTSVDWPAATAPALTASGVDLLFFTTIDGGTIWYGTAVVGMG